MPRRQLLLVVVVFGVAAGPLDPGSGLTGTLHYTRQHPLEPRSGFRWGRVERGRNPSSSSMWTLRPTGRVCVLLDAARHPEARARGAVRVLLDAARHPEARARGAVRSLSSRPPPRCGAAEKVRVVAPGPRKLGPRRSPRTFSGAPRARVSPGQGPARASSLVHVRAAYRSDRGGVSGDPFRRDVPVEGQSVWPSLVADAFGSVGFEYSP